MAQFNHHTDEARYAQSILHELDVIEACKHRRPLSLSEMFYYVNLCFEVYRLSAPVIDELFTSENGKLCVR